MAIDARIRTVLQDGEDLILELAPRVTDNKHLTNPGQPQLIIKNFTHVPVSGQAIWGVSDSCIIEPGFGITEQRKYKRVGSTTLVER